MHFNKTVLAVVAAACMAGQAIAHDYQVESLVIDHPWARAMPTTATTGATYLRIDNNGEVGDRLLGVETPAAKSAELHEHVHAGGLMKMQKAADLTIDAGESVILEPGGYHIMLINLQQPLVDGEKFPMTLRFEQAGTVEVEVAVHKDAPKPKKKPAVEAHSDHPQ
ncbi:copper chaperone PCu(A)C [Pseudomonas saliphila]|uniref:copper chaperone PCu(A)C n=1 Tax=Pseudomonas saliphila TaxID=2586906 RepID=UPI001F438645|nr:copper chaperone PCu(A)C [Pseudomonas saliphila]